MKINRHGRAKVLTQQEIQLIFSHGLDNDRDHYTCPTTAAKIYHLIEELLLTANSDHPALSLPQ